MLATLVEAPFARPNWVFEEKYDGVRMLAYKEGTHVSLISRNAIDRTARYPEIAAAIQKLKPKTLWYRRRSSCIRCQECFTLPIIATREMLSSICGLRLPLRGRNRPKKKSPLPEASRARTHRKAIGTFPVVNHPVRRRLKSVSNCIKARARGCSVQKPCLYVCGKKIQRMAQGKSSPGG